MIKINYISCCAECSAYRLRKNGVSYCEKQEQEIDDNSENPVSSVLTGFPGWCPLSAACKPGETINVNYKKETKQILRIMGVNCDSDSDSIAEASYYLNSIVERSRKMELQKEAAN